jgi:DegV family protein with EDD domain
MQRVAIVTDGSSDLPREMVENYNIHIAPFQVVFGETAYQMMGNYGDLSPEEFYNKLATAKEFPTTAIPSPRSFQTAYENALNDAESVIAIFISSELSGTYQSGVRIASTFENQDVTVIDSKVAASTLGALVIEAAKMAKNGSSKKEILNRLDELIPNTKLVTIQDNIDAVYRSGRVGFLKKFLVSTFKIKPILHFENGKIVPGGIIRGREDADNAMREAAKNIIKNTKTDTLFVWHVRYEKFANELKEIMEKDNPNNVNIIVIEAGPVVGVHVGPKSTAFMYIGDYQSEWLLGEDKKKKK